MNIELPESFTQYNGRGVRIVYIEDNILKMKVDVGFKRLMRTIVRQKRGVRCFYCGKILSEGELTVDHIIPQEIGGPTITNNLVPACKECNCEKSNMNAIQYSKYLKRRTSDAKKNYFKEVQIKNEKLKRVKNFSFLNGWVTEMEINQIKGYKEHRYYFCIDNNQKRSTRKKQLKYERAEYFYKEYGRLRKAIIVDRNNRLLSGYTSLKFAKNNCIKKVPVIKLDNVEIFY